MLNPSSLESILVKSVSMEVRSAESFALSRLPWLTVSRSLPSGGEIRRGGGEGWEKRQKTAMKISICHPSTAHCGSANAQTNSSLQGIHLFIKGNKKTFSHELFSCCVDAAQLGVSSELLTLHVSIETGVGPKWELMTEIKPQTSAWEEKSLSSM